MTVHHPFVHGIASHQFMETGRWCAKDARFTVEPVFLALTVQGDDMKNGSGFSQHIL